MLFVIIIEIPAFCQTSIQSGDRCFDSGDYNCAVINYDNVFKNATGKDKQIAEIKLTRTKWCADHIKTANQAFTDRNYQLAKENYQNVLESNPKDTYVNSQVAKCNNILHPPIITLKTSTENLSFPSSGGNESVTVTTNAESFSVDVLPYWCSVQKYSGYFIVSCIENSSNTSRTGYFMVLAGNKSVRVDVSQLSGSKPKEGSLRVTKENLIFYSSGGSSEAITVYSNWGSYSITHVPRWCTVQQNSDYFFISCKANKRKKIRSNWFKVSDGYNELIIYVSQAGK